jgi:hypothetical protein
MAKKLTSEEKNNAINRIVDARKKTENYASEARVNRIFEKNQSTSPLVFSQPDFKSKREAANSLANMYEQETENMRVRLQPNSREQYQHEKEQGDPNALRLSFEEWKKL